jgi:hypothetical protein
MTEVLRDFLSPSIKLLRLYLKLGHDRFLPYPFKFIMPVIQRLID